MSGPRLQAKTGKMALKNFERSGIIRITRDNIRRILVCIYEGRGNINKQFGARNFGY